MSFAEYEVSVTAHAHIQYCSRVEPIGKDELQELLTEQIASEVYYRKAEYIRLEGVWWVFEIRDGTMIFITCYGRTSIDIPSALNWARRHRDRISLTGGEVLCDVKVD